MTVAIAVLSLVFVVQSFIGFRLLTRLRQVDHVHERLRRLAQATTLLADTTEAGLTALASEVSRVGQRRVAPRTPARTTAKRIASAARSGQSIGAIAGSESLSEGEVRLHLALADEELSAA
ncbi:MAG TPA: hypothetical protein VN700_13350 [Vicinamibacterales bacterium]|nr:hypothetical protein [Vicinamibacterales bacterium]